MSRPISNLPSDLAWCLLTPPVMTLLWWAISKAKAGSLLMTSKGARSLNEDEDVTVQGWIQDGWKLLLGTMYAVAILMLIYVYFIKT